MSVPNPGITMTGREINKAISKQQTLPTGPTTYGPIIRFDFAQPEDSFTIEITHLNDMQLDSYVELVATIGATLSVEDDAGKTWTGMVHGTGQTRLRGTSLSSFRINMESVNLNDN